MHTLSVWAAKSEEVDSLKLAITDEDDDEEELR
jgi:hypothetical protein